ncbi:hypothetical protein TRFO_36957 [Tritrichomonas foetus]|uniref:Uncharacterized protein n=1 Tax=Tritrichomonas foetus TaxID=1144522 RepID=A0A1J4JDS0_9EUKA|nr:hypothetical protein TRFO_36957 [Tritrichomonas foetus]|eukprot:OHS96801.1 hypothetical protein TRFO_36957 [Tritrichomonas foetus]
MFLIKKFRNPAGKEWRRFESSGNKMNDADLSYSSAIKTSFDKYFINYVRSLSPSNLDPFLKCQNQFLIYSSRIDIRIQSTIFQTECIKNLKQIHAAFSQEKEQYDLILQQEKEAQKQLSQSSKTLLQIQNQNDFHKADLNHQNLLSNGNQALNETNQAQREFQKKLEEYQKNFINILVSNLSVSADAQSKAAKNSIEMTEDILQLSKEDFHYPEIKMDSVDYDKLRRKIQKNNEIIENANKIASSVKEID